MHSRVGNGLSFVLGLILMFVGGGGWSSRCILRIDCRKSNKQQTLLLHDNGNGVAGLVDSLLLWSTSGRLYIAHGRLSSLPAVALLWGSNIDYRWLVRFFSVFFSTREFFCESSYYAGLARTWNNQRCESAHPKFVEFRRAHYYLFFIFFSNTSTFQLVDKRWSQGVVPSSPRFLPSIVIAHRVQQSHCSSIFHRVLLTNALAFSASQFMRKKKSPRIYTRMHSGGFELTKLTYTRLARG